MIKTISDSASALKNRRPTLRDVAHEAGVSHMTVSRVVRGSRVVAVKTVTAVQAAIEKLGYRSDPALSALAAYRTRGGGKGKGSVLAFLDCDGEGYSQLVLEGAREEAERLGYRIVSHRLPSLVAAQQRLSRTLFHQGIQGILFGPAQTPQSFSGWDWSHFAAVSLGALFHQPAFNTVTTDYFEGAARAVDFLQQVGCQRIGLAVNPKLENRTAHRWLGGYASRIQNQPSLIWNDSPSKPQLKIWAKTKRVDGILTIHQRVWKALRPVKCVFLNAFECPPAIPRIAYDASRIGIEGVRVVHHQLLNQELGIPVEVKTVSLPPSLVLRG